MPAVVSAANEVAVKYFLDEKIGYGAIAGVINATMEAHTPSPIKTIEDALAADLWARREAERIIGSAVKSERTKSK